MRILTIVLTAAVLLMSAVDATGQPGRRPGVNGGGGGGGGNANSNTLSTGSNSNTNANSNSQFLSGNNTGVNNGALEVYAGSEPYQGIILEGSTNLPQLPGVPASPSNFSQPYKPDAFINTPVFLPAEMTQAEAKDCRNAKATWYGGGRDDEASSIKLFYATKPDPGPGGVTMANYVGTVMTTTSDGPFIAALCEAAYRAMRKGATVGMVEFSIRPKNTMVGIGFGASGGATGLPAAGVHPYAIAGTLGFGTGWSNQRVEGEVLLQLTALRGTVKAASVPASDASAPTPAAAAPAGDAPASSDAASPPATPATAAPVDDAPAPAGTSALPATPAAPAPASDTPAPVTGTPSTERYPAAAPRVVLTGSGPTPRVATEPRASSPRSTGHTLAYHSPRMLARIQKGHSKERVFEVFGTAFVKQDGKIVEVQGMRLRASGQSGRSLRIEISEVNLADGDGRATPYWFLFDDDRLIAWGRPEQWSAAARHHGIDVPYRPEPPAPRVEAKVELASSR